MKISALGIIRNIPVYAAAAILLPLCGGCDDGRIYEEASSGSSREGSTVRFSGNLNGTADQGTDYTVALAGFLPDSEYAEISKNLTDGEQNLTLTGIPAGVTSIEVCLLNSIRKRVVTFASMNLEGDAEISTFDAGKLSVSQFDAIQTGILTPSCERCHGAGGHAAAGLSLLLGESRDQLVGVPSRVMDGLMRVSPGHPEESTLWLAVGSGESDSWAFSHRELLTPERRELILSWISR